MPGREGGSYLRDPVTGDLTREDPATSGTAPETPPPAPTDAGLATDAAKPTPSETAEADTATSTRKTKER